VVFCYKCSGDNILFRFEAYPTKYFGTNTLSGKSFYFASNLSPKPPFSRAPTTDFLVGAGWSLPLITQQIESGVQIIWAYSLYLNLSFRSRQRLTAGQVLCRCLSLECPIQTRFSSLKWKDFNRNMWVDAHIYSRARRPVWSLLQRWARTADGAEDTLECLSKSRCYSQILTTQAAIPASLSLMVATAECFESREVQRSSPLAVVFTTLVLLTDQRQCWHRDHEKNVKNSFHKAVNYLQLQFL